MSFYVIIPVPVFEPFDRTSFAPSSKQKIEILNFKQIDQHSKSIITKSLTNTSTMKDLMKRERKIRNSIMVHWLHFTLPLSAHTK